MISFSQYIKITLASVALVTLMSCSTTTSLSFSPDFYQLQAIPSALKNKVLLESLTFTQPEKRQLLTQIEATDKELNLAAMTYSGLAIMQAKWHQEKGLVKFSSQVFDEGMLVRILRDIQLVKWPKSAIKKGLATGYQLITNNEANTKTRTIKSNNQVVVKMTYRDKKVVLTNFVEHYELVIERINE